MVAILIYFLGAVCAANGFQAQENVGSSTLRRSPTKRFFLLPKYLMKQMKPLNTNSVGPSETVSPIPHMLLSQEMNSLRSKNLPIPRDQLLRQERQDRLSQESRQLYEKEIRELIDVSESTERSGNDRREPVSGEQARFIAAPTQDNSITRPCYFSPVQCLLNIPEERINNFVEFVVPVAGAESEDLGVDSEIGEEIDAMSDDDNSRKAIRSAAGVTDPDMMSAASGLLEAQLSAGKEVAKSAADTPQRNRTPALRQRLASGSNGFGHPSSNPSGRNQPTSARDLAHMFLAQRHASRLRPFLMNGNGVSRTGKSNWRLSL
ncbi:hypothetical protein Ddc_12964 [Ditylenchus destructor]|nr:hypothetical protein Ddc_12964 [Ditylenchus destructor]